MVTNKSILTTLALKITFFVLLIPLCIFRISEAKEMEAVELRIESDKDEYMVDEPINITLSLKNNSKDEINILINNDVGLIFELGKFIVLDSQNNVLGTIGMSHRVEPVTSSGFILLKEGDVFKKDIKMFVGENWCYSTSGKNMLNLPPGRYLIKFIYLSDVFGESIIRTSAQKFGLHNYWNKKIESNTLNVEITRKLNYISKNEAEKIARTELSMRKIKEKGMLLEDVIDENDNWKIIFKPLTSIPVSDKYNSIVTIDKKTGAVIGN